jgi:class 3 adenylate cyclase
MARTETVTVVFTDLVGSTELASRLGHAAYEALRHEHFAALRAAVTKHGGSEVKTTGDGLMLRFDSVARAIAGAVAMQQAVASRNPAPPHLPALASLAAEGQDEGSTVQIRVGVSAGEATHDGGDLYGLPVVEAARLCAAAGAGQIVVSDVVRLMARGHGHTFTTLGELTLKGLPEPLAAYEVRWEPLAPEGLPLPPRLTMPAAVAMVGRAAESEALAAAWAKATEGQRQVVLIAGEPGIGKTRLATEAALAAHAAGAAVLFGSCDEDVAAPYRPFVEALRHYVTHAPNDVLAAHVREHKGELGRLLPELGRRVAALPAPQVAAAETERYLLFEAVTGLLSEASQRQPIVLILDDLHWAGAPELLLLKHMLKSAMPLRLLIVGTYRDTDLLRTHPLAAALADFRRETGVQRLALHGLDEAAVVSLVTAAAGHALAEPGIALARVLQRETEGNPFFIAEILRHLSESGTVFRAGERWMYAGDVAGLGIPESVKEVIGRRLGRLSEPAAKLLTLAAVIGRQFDLATLVRVAQEEEEAVLDALDEAMRVALVTELAGSAGQFSFTHALIRTTLYEELSATRRARLHRTVGEVLEELTRATPGARLAELAYHWLQATRVADAEKAIRYTRQAGDRALANLAFEEAAAHYERALGVLEPGDPQSIELRCDLLLALAEAQRRGGDVRYRETVPAAAELARALGDGERLALAALTNARPGGLLANVNLANESLIALYEEALAALDEGDSLVRARLLGQLAVELAYTPQVERRDALSRDAVAIARRLGDRGGLGEVLNLRLAAINHPFTLAERLALTAELAALAREVGSNEPRLPCRLPSHGRAARSGRHRRGGRRGAPVGEPGGPLAAAVLYLDRRHDAHDARHPPRRPGCGATGARGLRARHRRRAARCARGVRGAVERRSDESGPGRRDDRAVARADRCDAAHSLVACRPGACLRGVRPARRRPGTDRTAARGAVRSPSRLVVGILHGLRERCRVCPRRHGCRSGALRAVATRRGTGAYRRRRDRLRRLLLPLVRRARRVSAALGGRRAPFRRCAGDERTTRCTPVRGPHPARLGRDAARPRRRRRPRPRPRPHRRRPCRGGAPRHGARAGAVRASR